ncbi:hypothetical protein CUMW_168680 [Citrus unshiu]|uniref:Uncharacterized protein n=1 Tax=Citrus unshiu TaxID=55188 RepID=A0A2H5PUI8_CITUN|nr:hypothetical protein CUMW_168680 [Citrus unshiu]
MLELPLFPWTPNLQIVQYHILRVAETHCVNRQQIPQDKLHHFLNSLQSTLTNYITI